MAKDGAGAKRKGKQDKAKHSPKKKKKNSNTTDDGRKRKNDEVAMMEGEAGRATQQSNRRDERMATAKEGGANRAMGSNRLRGRQ